MLRVENPSIHSLLDQVDFSSPVRSLHKSKREPLDAITVAGQRLIQACQRAECGGFLEERAFRVLFTEEGTDHTGAPLVRAATYSESNEGSILDQLRLVIVSGLKEEHDLNTRLFDQGARQAFREARFAEEGFGKVFCELMNQQFLDTLLKDHPLALTDKGVVASIWITRSFDPKIAAELRRDSAIRKAGREYLIENCPHTTTVSIRIEPVSPNAPSYEFDLNASSKPVRITVPYSVLKGIDFDDKPIPPGTLATRKIERKVGSGDVYIAEALCGGAFEWFERALNKQLVGYTLPEN